MEGGYVQWQKEVMEEAHKLCWKEKESVMHDERHMNKKDVHFGKYGSGLPLWDIHLCQI